VEITQENEDFSSRTLNPSNYVIFEKGGEGEKG
jgi:hypothetical protein